MYFARFKILICLLVVASFSGYSHSLSEKKTAAIKVAYLYYFSKFISWPESSQFPRDKLNLCTGAVSPDIEFQLSTINEKRVGDKQLNVIILDIQGKSEGKTVNSGEKVESWDLLNKCQILYVGPGLYNWYLSNHLKVPSQTLVVSDTQDTPGRVILLHTLNNKLSFDINTEVANAKSLKISSKLLRLSKKRQR